MVLQGITEYWPAIHHWADFDYLKRIAGHRYIYNLNDAYYIIETFEIIRLSIVMFRSVPIELNNYQSESFAFRVETLV